MKTRAVFIHHTLQRRCFSKDRRASFTTTITCGRAGVTTTTTCCKASVTTTTTETKEKVRLVWRLGSTNYGSCRALPQGEIYFV
ncbi:hypothetical protein DPMN_106496 [Dreissena polymorpha]|uniref:Uncharacterized protein n=1 Tax=Dreissena polymorpha TaxID=45954 RepID=A0A9D4K536_DREPO|nr:hypothetical protein DPMN_106496 [Dreissena polymorpha]